MKIAYVIALVLVIVGALNWGLVGAFNFDLVRATFGASPLTSLVYGLVGIAGLYVAVHLLTNGGRRAAAPVRV